MNYIEDLESRVNAGIVLLDEKWPDWYIDLNTVTLDVSDGHCCVTAQYAKKFISDDASWMEGMIALGLDDDDEVDSEAAHGFNVMYGETAVDSHGESSSRQVLRDLTDLWKTAVFDRRAEDESWIGE